MVIIIVRYGSICLCDCVIATSTVKRESMVPMIESSVNEAWSHSAREGSVGLPVSWLLPASWTAIWTSCFHLC